MPRVLLPQLTLKQQMAYDFIKDFTKDHGYPPLFRQIAESLHITVGSVQWRIKGLESKGVLIKIPNEARTIKLV